MSTDPGALGELGVEERFEAYLQQLARVVGHADRREPLSAYCRGLLLPGDRKSIEPMAARIDPRRVASRHQSMHHFVANAPWDSDALIREAREYALPGILAHAPLEGWIIDDTGFPKKGDHSVGVAHQYCGALGKTANSQNAVSVSLANRSASIPVAFRLFLPRAWADDSTRREKVGVPVDVSFMTKPEIALALIDGLINDDVAAAPVLADAAYGDSVAFRDGLTLRGMVYTLGVSSSISVWPPGEGPLPPLPYSGLGRRPKRLRRTKDHKPVSAKQLASTLPSDAWETVRWREGTAGPMESQFCALRVRPAHQDDKRVEPRAEEWLLIEWPPGETEPTKYWLSTHPPGISLADLVQEAKLRWRIERDYQELKDEIGLDHYEGRSWRGFHHHAALCIAAYAFLIAERARLSPPGARAIFGFKESPLSQGGRRGTDPRAR